MDIEHIIVSDVILRDSLLPIYIKQIIYNYISFNFNYNSIIQHHIDHLNRASQILSRELALEFHIEDHIKYELYSIIDNLPISEHPTFIDTSYNYSPQISFPFNVRYHCYVWEFLDLEEPDCY